MTIVLMPITGLDRLQYGAYWRPTPVDEALLVFFAYTRKEVYDFTRKLVDTADLDRELESLVIEDHIKVVDYGEPSTDIIGFGVTPFSVTLS